MIATDPRPSAAAGPVDRRSPVDGLVAAYAAARDNAALLFTDGTTVPAETAAYLAETGRYLYTVGAAATATLPGGQPIVAPTADALTETVDDTLFNSSPVFAVAATGDGSAGGLAAMHAARMGATLVLASGGHLGDRGVAMIGARRKTLSTFVLHAGTVCLSMTVDAEVLDAARRPT